MDDRNIEHNLYTYFSECLKFLKKRFSLLFRFSTSISTSKFHQDLTQTQQKYQSLMTQIETIFLSFRQYSPEINNHQNICNRFFLRANQYILSIQSSNAIHQTLFKYILEIKSALGRTEIKENIIETLYLMLIYLPPKLRTISKIKGIHELQYQKLKLKMYPSQEKTTRKKQQQQQTENYQKHLNSLERQYKLLDCLDLDEAQLRKRFFISRQDHHRKGDALLSENILRNKLLNFSINSYAQRYDLYRCKRKRKPLKKIRKQLSLNNHNSMLKEMIKSSSTHKNPNILLRPSVEKRYKRIDFNYNNSLRNPIRERVKTYSFTEDKERMEELIERAKMGQINEVETKKIQIQKGKIELGPIRDEDQVEKMNKKKVFYKKTQQYFKKRFTVMAQEKVLQNKYKKSLNQLLYVEGK